MYKEWYFNHCHIIEQVQNSPDHNKFSDEDVVVLDLSRKVRQYLEVFDMYKLMKLMFQLVVKV